jgi:hypothetical protein
MVMYVEQPVNGYRIWFDLLKWHKILPLITLTRIDCALSW